MKMKPILRAVAGISLFAVLLSLSMPGCHQPAASIKKWESVPLNAAYEVPALAGKTEEGDAALTLRPDSTLEYAFHVHNLSGGDVLTGASICYGDAGSNGAVVIDLLPVFTGAAASGKVPHLRAGQVDTLLNKPVYINVYSTRVASGIVRGQLDKPLEWAADIALHGGSETPPVATTASGLCILRLTSDQVLYSKLTVGNLEPGDTVTTAHVHCGPAGAQGDVTIHLSTAAAPSGSVQQSPHLPIIVTQWLKTEPFYVDVHSTRHPAGLLRGQLR